MLKHLPGVLLKPYMTETSDRYNLKRFLEAQELMYPMTLLELQRGRKRSHWMWYIFPQIKGLGLSQASQFFAISGADEASAYLADPVLDGRLRAVCRILLNLPGNDSEEIFGNIDSKKLRSSMTLFDAVAPDDIFTEVLDKYYEGKRDKRTLAILSSAL